MRHTTDSESARVRGMKAGSDRISQREVVKERNRGGKEGTKYGH